MFPDSINSTLHPEVRCSEPIVPQDSDLSIPISGSRTFEVALACIRCRTKASSRYIRKVQIQGDAYGRSKTGKLFFNFRIRNSFAVSG